MTKAFSPPKSESLGALAGATEAEFGTADRDGFYRARLDAATVLCLAIRDCHRDDAVKVMAAALVDLGVGAPIPALDSLLEEARLWAGFATPVELKAYALATVERMGPRDRTKFIAYAAKRFSPPKRLKGAAA